MDRGKNWSETRRHDDKGELICFGHQVNEMNKKILLVSYYTPPVMNAESILVWKTVRELAHHLDIGIITSSVPMGTRIDPQMSLAPPVKVIRSRAWKPHNLLVRKATNRLIGLLADEEYLWTKSRLQSPNLVDCDVIYSRSHPGASHILAHKIKMKIRKPWIAQFSDPWTRNPYHKHHCFARKVFDRYWEHKVVEDADVLIFPTVEIQEMYSEAYGHPYIKQKSTILPHHYTPELYQGAVNKRSQTDATVSFSYFGDFYGMRSPEPLLAGLQQIARVHPDLLNRIQVNFYGNIESKFVELVRNSPLTINVQKVSYLHMTRKGSLLQL